MHPYAAHLFSVDDFVVATGKDANSIMHDMTVVIVG